MDLAPIEWTASAGGQIDSDSHGDVNLGVRRGDWTFLLRTDAPEITWGPSGDHGRAWVTARGHGFAAGMLISPWTDGAPDPGRSLRASTVGAEAGLVRYGPAGLYGGGRVAIDGAFFGGFEDTTVAVPAPRLVATAEAVGGWYRPEVQAWVRAGVDLETPGGAPLPISPHVAGELHWIPGWKVGSVALAPRAEAWVGAAGPQDYLLRARIGGTTPYVVPLAGAAWGEFWVEDYAVARVGPSVGLGFGDAGVRVSPFADLAGFSDPSVDLGPAAPGPLTLRGDLGLGLGVRAWWKRFYADATGGYSPTIERQPGYSRASVSFSLGADWGAGTTHSGSRPPGPIGSYWPA
jgi:hypothetical protein